MTRKHLLAAGALILLLLAGVRGQQLSAIAAAPAADVLVAYGATPGGVDSVRMTWETDLKQRGLPHEWVRITDFGMLDGAALARKFAVIVIPRAISRTVPDAARAQFNDFVAAGGRVITSPDAASIAKLVDRQRSMQPG